MDTITHAVNHNDKGIAMNKKTMVVRKKHRKKVQRMKAKQRALRAAKKSA